MQNTKLNNAKTKKDEYVGKVGENLKDMKVIFTKCRKFDDYYGTTYFAEFVDDARRLLVWRTNKGAVTGFEAGDKFLLSGFVEAHDECKGTKQTMITRAKLVKLN